MGKRSSEGWRCDEVFVTLVLRRYDAEGRPTDERILGGTNEQGQVSPLKAYRSQAANFWATMDAIVRRFLSESTKASVE